MRRFLIPTILLALLFAPTAPPTQTNAQTNTQTRDHLGEFLFTTDSIIFGINADGSNRRELFDGSGFGYDGDASWSPDGLFVAFNSYTYNNTGDVVYIGNTRDQSLQRLTLPSTLELYAAPQWAPDGSGLVFAASLFGGSDTQRAIYVVSYDGSGLHAVREPADDGFMLAAPVFSPDGTQIIFAEIDTERTHQDRLPTRIMSMDVDGSNAHLLFEVESEISQIAVSPDGSQLAFLVNLGSFGGYDDVPKIYVTHLDGSDLRGFKANSPSSAPVWSPDGTMIAYSGYRSMDERGIFITDLEGTSERLIPQTFGTNQIDWTPGAVESQIAGIEVTDRNISTVIDSDEYVLDNCGSPAQRTDSWRIEHELKRSFSFLTSTSGGTETTTCTGTNRTATWDIGGEIGPIKELINISGGYSHSTEETSQTCTAISDELTTAYRLDQESSVTESREFSVELPPDSIVKYEITVYEVALQGYVTVARANDFYSDSVQIPFLLHDRIRIDARPVPVSCPG